MRDYDKEYENKMMECLEILLENKFNPMSQNLYLGQTMLFYALVNQKYKSADKILQYINKANITTLKIGRNQMKPVAATVISPNFEYFKKMIEKEKTAFGIDFDLILIEDSNLNNQIYTFVSYLAKKHRITKGKNEEIK
jgi:hypothetical protein